MVKRIADLKELSEADQFVRIPPEQDVPITRRVRAVLDTTAMQRLRRISQLGLVSLAYPGAVHSRLEHSLGVYRLACLALRQLALSQPEELAVISEHDLRVFLLASLLHDVGHWPYCHPIEDMQIPGLITHEQAARSWICDDPLASIIRDQWQIEPSSVADFLAHRSQDRSRMLLQNILNGPVDIDKMDYLQRDSYHAGVPYGRNFDSSRLLNSLRFGNSQVMAITGKGKTAAEMMVFSRYVMFSEVYWHHTVRSATAMLQRAVYRLKDRLDFSEWANFSDADFQNSLVNCSTNDGSVSALCNGLFHPGRWLFKRWAQFSVSSEPVVHSRLAHRSYGDLVTIAQRLSARLAKKTRAAIGPDDILIDAPPVKLEIQFRLDIKSGESLMPLADLSPVVRSLATDQFDNFVKTVRVFVAPGLQQRIDVDESEIAEMLLECAG